MKFNKVAMNNFLFIATHWLSCVNLVSILSIISITISRNLGRIGDLKIYIFAAEIIVFWYLPRVIAHEPKGEWLGFILTLMGAFITVALLYYSIFDGWVI